MTSDILADMRKRDRLAKRRDRRDEYRCLRNDIVKRVRTAEREDLQQKISKNWNNIKKQWQILKKVTNNLNNKSVITTTFYHNGIWVEDKQTNAENMNQYLSQVGPTTNESVGQPLHPSDHYLRKNSKANKESILLSNVTEQDVKEVCQKINPKTSCDANGLAQNIVLEDIDIMAPVIAHLVNCSQSSGICPDSSKIARVILIYKNKGNKHHYENYRPISLLPAFSKIMEKLIYNKIFEFLVRYEILFKSQYGFRSGHNTTHATLDFLKTIEDAAENDEISVGVFCDLSKAFDTLNHDITPQQARTLWHQGKG